MKNATLILFLVTAFNYGATVAIADGCTCIITPSGETECLICPVGVIPSENDIKRAKPTSSSSEPNFSSAPSVSDNQANDPTPESNE